MCFLVVAGLTKQHVSDLDSIEVLIEQGNKLRFVLWYLQILLVFVSAQVKFFHIFNKLLAHLEATWINK